MLTQRLIDGDQQVRLRRHFLVNGARRALQTDAVLLLFFPSRRHVIQHERHAARAAGEHPCAAEGDVRLKDQVGLLARDQGEQLLRVALAMPNPHSVAQAQRKRTRQQFLHVIAIQADRGSGVAAFGGFHALHMMTKRLKRAQQRCGANDMPCLS